MKTPKGQVNWTPDETRYLLKWAGTKSKEEIAADLSTTVERVVNKARNHMIDLGVKVA